MSAYILFQNIPFIYKKGSNWTILLAPAHLDDPDLWRKNIKLDHPFAPDWHIQMIRIICKKQSIFLSFFQKSGSSR